MSIYGIDPLGSGLGPAGGPGLITVLGVLPESNNRFVVIFDREPESLDPQSFASATNEENYTLAAIDPAVVTGNGDIFVPSGEVVPTREPYSATAEVDSVDPKQIVVATDAALESRVRYSVTISTSIKGKNGETFAGPTVFEFRALRYAPPKNRLVISEERYRDFDYVINAGTDQKNQVYRIEDNGDIAIQPASISLRKRIYRRVFTDPGGLSWAPGYGAGIRVKRLAKAGSSQSLANLINEQIQAEPDVAYAGTSVSVDRTTAGTFINVESRVQRTDAREVRVVFSERV